MITSTFFIIIVTIAIMHQGTIAFYLPKRVDRLSDNLMDPKKRPFCNAFTGCGRKRSNLPALPNQSDSVDESINSLLQLSAEPAVEDLTRQIMSEAKLWEAIQEANVELSRHKQEQESTENHDRRPERPLRISATSSCAIPPCYT